MNRAVYKLDGILLGLEGILSQAFGSACFGIADIDSYPAERGALANDGQLRPRDDFDMMLEFVRSRLRGLRGQPGEHDHGRGRAAMRQHELARFPVLDLDDLCRRFPIAIFDLIRRQQLEILRRKRGIVEGQSIDPCAVQPHGVRHLFYVWTEVAQSEACRASLCRNSGRHRCRLTIDIKDGAMGHVIVNRCDVIPRAEFQSRRNGFNAMLIVERNAEIQGEFAILLCTHP